MPGQEVFESHGCWGLDTTSHSSALFESRPHGCPCGFLTDPKNECHCTARQISSDMSRIGGLLLATAMSQIALSARAHDKILKVARTIADLEGHAAIHPDDLAEAINYRSLDRQLWA